MQQTASVPSATEAPSTATPAAGLQRAEVESALKSLAKAIARDVSARIPDRHVRAAVRTDCYNRMVTVLQNMEGRQTVLRARYQRTQVALAAVSALLVAAVALSLAF